MDLKGIIEAKLQQCIYERNRLERYITTIEDSLLRQVFTYRFVNGLPWQQVAACIGGSNTADGVRMMCNRYIKATEPELLGIPDRSDEQDTALASSSRRRFLSISISRLR